MNEHPRVLSSAAIIGDKVMNSEGEQLGVIRDLVIDLDDAQIAYAVLFSGGFMGLGNKFFAIPLEALTFISEEHTAILDIDKQGLKSTPEFDKEYLPQEAEAGWLLDTYEYYSYSPYRMPDE